MKMCWNSVLSKTAIFRFSWWIVGPSTSIIQWTGALFEKFWSWGSSKQSGQLRCLQAPQHVVFNLGVPRPAMTAFDFCAVHWFLKLFYSIFTAPDLKWLLLTWPDLTPLLDLTWPDLTGLGLTWIHLPWLDLTWFALGWPGLTGLALNWSDLTWLDLLWLEHVLIFCSCPFWALVAPATWAPQDVVFSPGSPRPAMTACDFCAVHQFL